VKKADKVKYVNVALPVPVDREFTYSVPARLSGAALPGCRAKVQFGRRTMTGYITSFTGRPRGRFRIREISEVLDAAPLLSEDLMRLAGWISRYYAHPVGEVLKAMLPAGLKGKGRKAPDAAGRGGGGFPRDAESPTLNTQQREVFSVVSDSIAKGEYRSVLLHGVTGSGKTEVYLRCIEEALDRGRGAIVLIPEIALIPQTTARFRRRFEGGVGVLHSRLTGPQRHDIWKKASTGEFKVVIGPRSAVFSPVKDLGIIVIDEEQDSSFKQQDKPHYNAVDVAEYRAEAEKSVLLMGSATPSLNRYKKAKEGESGYFRLESRPSFFRMPRVDIVDMRKRKGILSEELLDSLEASVKRKEQGIVLINRRGHANFVQCRKCGWIERCPNCSISLTYHSRGGSQICHYCGYAKKPPERCPECGSFQVGKAGAGTQRVEIELSNLMPGARIARMDFDTTSGKNGHSEILERFGRREADILLGTQMVAKGHHYPNVTVVGVISADYGLNFPDFMASERTFQLLFQAAGRAGRGEKEGRVIVQTRTPEHYIFRHLRSHDFDGFAESELELRSEMNYPPQTGLMLFTVNSRRKKDAREGAERISSELEGMAGGRGFTVLGPAPAQIGRLRGRYRFQLLIKGSFDSKSKRELVALAGGSLNKMKNTRLKWDVDPVTFF